MNFNNCALVSIHPIIFGSYHLKNDLNDFELIINSLNINKIAFKFEERNFPEIFSENYSNKLRIPLNNNDTEIVYIGSMLGYVIHKSYISFNSENDFNGFDKIDYYRKYDLNELLKCEIFNLIKNCLNQTIDYDVFNKDIRLTWAFSQNLFLKRFPEDKKLKTIELLAGNDSKKGGNVSINYSCVGSISNIFYVKDENFNAVLDCISGITLNTAVMHDIQNITIDLAKKIIIDKYTRTEVFNNIDVYHNFISSFNQFLVDSQREDYLSNDVEEATGRFIYEMWHYEDISKKTSKCVEHANNQLSKISSKIERDQNDKMNKLLFLMTILSLSSLTSGLIAFYDIQNQILPSTRIVSVTIVTSILIVFSVIYVFGYIKKDLLK